MMPEIVPNSPMKGAEVAMVARMFRPLLQVLVEQDGSPFAAPLGGVDLLFEAQVGFLAGQEFLDAGGRHAGQVAALVVLLGREGQGFLELSGLEKLGELRGDELGLRLGAHERQLALDEQVEGNDRQGDEENRNRLGHAAHGLPHFNQTELHLKYLLIRSRKPLIIALIT